MKIETKFDMEQQVWVMYKNKPVATKVTGIHLHSYGLRYATQPRGDSHLSEFYPESQLFATKQELLDSL